MIDIDSKLSYTESPQKLPLEVSYLKSGCQPAPTKLASQIQSVQLIHFPHLQITSEIAAPALHLSHWIKVFSLLLNFNISQYSHRVWKVKKRNITKFFMYCNNERLNENNKFKSLVFSCCVDLFILQRRHQCYHNSQLGSFFVGQLQLLPRDECEGRREGAGQLPGPVSPGDNNQTKW